MSLPVNHDILCVAQPSWSGSYAKSTVLLMKQVAERNRVLYVDYGYTWKDLFESLFKKTGAPILKMLRLKDPLRIVLVKNKQMRLAVLTLPPLLPLHFLPHGQLYKILNGFNGWLAGLSIRKALKRIRFKEPVVINAFAPSLGISLQCQLHAKSTIYYCYDEIKEAAWSAKHGGAMEEEFAQKSDAVIVTSDSLKNEKNNLNKNIYVVKNGVDTKLFRVRTPLANSKIKSPIVGFVGSLDNRIDYDLLKEVIQQSPEWQFRFIGRIVDSRFNELKKFSNVLWISPVSYDELPPMVQEFTIGIIPFVKSPFTEKIYPLKINEYLAMGKPVVMTSFAQLPEFNSIVERADSAKQFKNSILKCIETDDDAKRKQRVLLAQKNSWEERSIEIQHIIERVCEQN